jgi:hypothetical protein
MRKKYEVLNYLNKSLLEKIIILLLKYLVTRLKIKDYLVLANAFFDSAIASFN